MKQRSQGLHAATQFLAKFQKSHLIMPIAFLNATAFSGINLAMIFHLRYRFDAGAGIIGLATALQWAAYLVGTLSLRPLTRILLPRYSLIISATAMTVLTVLVSQARTLPLAIAGLAAIGLSISLFWPPIMGWLSAGAEGAQLSRRIGRFNLSWSVGVILGPYLAGLLTEVSSRLPLYAGAVAFASVGLMTLAASLFMQSIRTDTHRDPPRNTAREPDNSTPLRFPSWVGLIGAYALFGTLSVVFPLFARDQLAVRESLIGSVLLLRGFALAAGFVVAGRTVAWHFRRLPILVPIVVLIGTSIALAFSETLLGYALIIPLVGLAVAGTYSASVFHGVAGSAERARRMGVHEALLTVGFIVGALGGGTLYQRVGVRAVFVACAMLLTAVFAAQAVLLLRQRRALPD